MGLSSGFFISKNGDRKYGAIEFGSIFDGIIRDGVFMDCGDHFSVYSKEEDMRVYIGTGRAWFMHTWTLVDNASYPITIPQSEVILNRIDAIVLDVDIRESTRKNSFKVVSGQPAEHPSRPTNFINEDNHRQYPIAFVTVLGKSTYVRNADIVNVVGVTSQGGPPFVTAPLEIADLSSIYSHIESQWSTFYTNANTVLDQIINLYNSVHAQYNNFLRDLDAMKADANSRINDLIRSCDESFGTFLSTSTTRFNNMITSDQEIFETLIDEFDSKFKRFMIDHTRGFDDFVELKDQEFEERMDEWDRDFSSFWTEFKEGMVEYLRIQEDIWKTWFNHIQGQLSDDAATNLQRQIDALSFVYILGERAVLGITASAIHERVVFGTYGSVAGNKIMVTAPSRDTVWVFDEKAILSVIATVVHNKAIFSAYGGISDNRVVITAPSWQPVH